MIKTYLRIPHGRDGGVCVGSARSEERDLVVPNERRATRRYAANAPSLWVARQSLAGYVNRLGDSYSYPPAPRALPANDWRSNAAREEF